MKVLLVHAHPEPKSFSAALKDKADKQLRNQGHEVRLSDLYAMSFNPVASPKDFTERADPDYCTYALEQRHAVSTGTLSPDIAQELDKLLWCDLLILNFPIFWFAPPAILKGWIDRVFVSGRIYGGKRFYDRGGLTGKRALVAVTLGGQRQMFGEHGIHGPLEDMLRPLLRGTLGYAGFTVLPLFVGWHVPYISDEARREILGAWRSRLAGLELEKKGMRFPTLDDFDERLFPKSPAESQSR